MPRYILLGLLLCTTTVVAQTPASPDNRLLTGRVDRIEKELRAVQRKVFPGGAGQYLEPELMPSTAAPASDGGLPATSAITDLNQRVGAIEGQLQSLTNQVEQNSFKLRQLEQQLAKLQENQAAAPVASSSPAPAPAAPSAPVAAVAAKPAPSATTSSAIVTSPAPAAVTGDAGEDAYMTGYRLWEAKRYSDAQTALRNVVAKHPKHRRASYAQNLLGRAYLDNGQLDLAAEAFLTSYQKMPRGERAADSLYYLGQTLTKLQRPDRACQVYDELRDVYGATLNSTLAARASKGRIDAKCTS
jgi:TolA-binding protein